MKKKLLACVMACMCVVGMVACDVAEEGTAVTPSDSTTEVVSESETEVAAELDSEYIKSKGTIVIGITDFEPMDYKDADGNWIGFDADMASAFAASLGVEAQFVEIDWDNKVMELNGKTVDCIWNGMTLTSEVTASMDCSNAYCNNAQIIVIDKKNEDKYSDLEVVKDAHVAVEAGSAGEAVATELGYTNIVPVESQANALLEVASGTCDVAIIDSLMAAAMVGEGTSYENLIYTTGLSDEKYGVGFRQGSDLPAMLNDFFKAAYADGSMMATAEKYGVQAAVIEQ